MKRAVFSKLIVLLLILLFAYTATSKFISHNLFVVQMEISPLPFIKTFAKTLGWLIPMLELTLVILLLTDRSRFYGLCGSLILLSIFEFYIVGMLLSGFHLPCSCGGIIGIMTWKAHLMFNAVFIGLSIFAIWHYKTDSILTDNLVN